jgi:hypothetical protein
MGVSCRLSVGRSRDAESARLIERIWWDVVRILCVSNGLASLAL